LKKKGQERALPGFIVFLCQLVFYICTYFPARPLAWLVRWSVKFMAKRFIAGETIEKAEKSLKSLFETKRDVTLDQLGELVVSEKEADHYCNEVLKLIHGFKLHVPKGELNGAGIPRANVSIKVSALCSDFKPAAPEYTYKLVAPRLKKILLAAKEEDVYLNIDTEHYDYRDIVFYVYGRVLLETPELKDFKKTGVVLQAYLRDAYKHYVDIVELAKKRGVTIPIRIVKGAYWDAETIEADAHSFDAPEFLNKEETDLHFRQLVLKILEDYPHVQLTLASHNFADHAFAVTARDKFYPEHPPIEHQCLDMTYEALSTGIAKMGWAIRNYVPVGSLLVGMAYLVRRIMENSSQVGVLTIMRSHKKKGSIVSPRDVYLENKKNGVLVRDASATDLTSHFFNISPLRVYLDEERGWMEKSIEEFAASGMGKDYPNAFELNGDWREVYSSSNPDLLVGKIKLGNGDDVNRAVETAKNAYNAGTWAKSLPIQRASTLLTAANIMLDQRNDLSSLIVYEAGKAIPEAQADIDEAIDFLTFYAREEIRLCNENPKLVSKGVVAVVSPWNFPIAIPCGMVSSPLVAGNTVVLKSASHTPLIAQKLVDIFHQAGVPKDVLIHVPGPGGVVGDTLVNHPDIAEVVFTGSKAVGMDLAHKVGKRMMYNELFDIKFPAKAITEMGGKNAVIVTANAELDETVAGILYSAFGHAGQKCSAASRVIVDNVVKDRLIERLKEAILDIQVGVAFDFSTYINPLITKREKERMQASIKEAVIEANEFGGKVHVNRSEEDVPGYCVGPSLIEVPAARALNSQSFAARELFGPCIHIIGFDTLDEAIKIFNSTEYALTGGVFSQSQDDIDYVTAHMEVGNLYVNRTITGARVAIEPFGGFKLSGTGPKAGSTSYVESFHLVKRNLQDGELPPDERGSDYQFCLCRPSQLSNAARLPRLNKALDFLVRHFEHLFKGVYGNNKEILIAFQTWLNEGFLDFQNKEHSNRVIPGQISYNDFSKTQEQAVLLAYNERPHFTTFLQFLSAVAMGTGVTVIARNQQAFGWWNTIKDFLVQGGISKENFDVFFATEELLIKALKDPYLSSVIIDGNLKRTQEVLNEVYDGSCAERRMRSILTPYDAPVEENFEKFMEQYVWVRSFAVNTMRHGAPLDLDLN
jgi:RHH-type proline utilization regulon transcriptional repressor/proline dehydrogenase/delta 1-pyrroline-5-carboxylate dehydrogenase